MSLATTVEGARRGRYARPVAVRRGVLLGTDRVVSPSGRVHEMSVPSPVNEKLLSQCLGALGSARSWAPNVLPELERFIRTADDYDLFRVNPIQYGGGVDLSEADAIELFVHAAKVGLFETYAYRDEPLRARFAEHLNIGGTARLRALR